MSPDEINVMAMKVDDIFVTIERPTPVELRTSTTPEVNVVVAGNLGPPGPPGQWTALTQAEYDALSPKDPEMLYIIVV